MRGVQKRIEGYARCAGVRVSGHRLRHNLATQLLNQGVRLVVVQELLSHATVTSTQRYARLANRRVREEYLDIRRLAAPWYNGHRVHRRRPDSMPQPIWTYLTALLYFTEVSTCLAIAEGLETASHDRLTRMLKGR
jgi:hypothetical protein